MPYSNTVVTNLGDLQESSRGVNTPATDSMDSSTLLAALCKEMTCNIWLGSLLHLTLILMHFILQDAALIFSW